MSFWILRKSVSFGFRYLDYHYLALLSYLPWILLIPTLFKLTCACEPDRFIGELSYPVYLIHLAMIPIARSLIPESSRFYGSLVTALTLVISILILLLVVRPVDVWRLRFTRGSRPSDEAQTADSQDEDPA